MATPVIAFNASIQNLTLAVNSGPQMALPGTNGDEYEWGPYPLFGSITYQPGYPKPGVLGNLGINQIQAYVENVPIGGGPFCFALPEHTIFGSVEIYFFFQSVQTVTWIVLIDGKPVAQQVIASLPGFEDDASGRRR
jgi:hypothetical protein